MSTSILKWRRSLGPVCVFCIFVVLLFVLYSYIGQNFKQLVVTEYLPGCRNNVQFKNHNVSLNFKIPKWESGDWMVRREKEAWIKQSCNVSKPFRHVTLLTKLGNLTFYVYDSGEIDRSVTKRAFAGQIFEKSEIEHFLELTNPLPLIDIGANVGLVTLQALMQGRVVVAIEPVPENALRLCRSAIDFQHSNHLVVVQNALSSEEGNVTLTSDGGSTVFQIQEKMAARTPQDKVTVFSILLDRLLEITPFRQAALKIDVESYEGHVLAGAHQLFLSLDIPYVWMEWIHVKGLKDYGGKYVITFMKKYAFEPYNLLTGKKLSVDNYQKWPFTVLWKRNSS